MTSSFFLNEIPYLKRAFDDVVIIAFGQNNEKTQKIIKEYGLNCRFCSLINMRLIHIWKWLKWLKMPHVSEEIKKYVTLSKIGLKRLVYIWFYGMYHILTENILSREIENNKSNIYLYAFWLSRPAYCISNMKEKYSDRILKVCSRAHGYDLYVERNNMYYLPFRSFIANRLDTIYFISEDGREYYQKNILGKNGLIKTCQLKLSRLGTKNSVGMKKQVVEKHQITIASCSSIISVKRIDLIIDVIKFLQSNNLNVQWIHIGDGDLMGNMYTTASDKLKKNSYQFLGWLDNARILQTYLDYDVDYFINMSDSEGIPVSVMEAMSMGIPVIARGIGGNGEIVNDENGCLLGKNLSIKNMQKIICEYVQIRVIKPGEYIRASNYAREQWEKYYSAEKNYTDFYYDVLYS